MQAYERTRDYNRDVISARREEIYKKIPELKEIDASVASVSVAHAKLLMEGDDNALTQLKAAIKGLSGKRAALLKEAGYPVDWLEPIYDCQDCKDTGYITASDGIKTKCHCLRRQEL
jgi:DNA replication protein DnaC